VRVVTTAQPPGGALPEPPLPGRLEPVTAQGAHFAALADELAARFWDRAADHDRDGSFPAENVADLVATRVIAVAVPERFGGLGVTSTLDLGVGLTRLARGCASTALGLNMHVAVCHNLSRRWQHLVDRGEDAAAERLGGQLALLGTGEMITCGPASEPGTNILHPELRAEAVEGGWALTGTKVFATFSPAATVLAITARVDAPDGPRLALAMVPVGTAGVRFCDDWDAIGVRASGSQTLRFDGAVVPRGLVRTLGPWGDWNEGWLDAFVTGTFGLAAPFCGVAEQAHHLAVAALAERRKGPSYGLLRERTEVQALVGANVGDLFACHGALERMGRRIDALHAAHPGSVPTAEHHRIFAELQTVKHFVTRTAIGVVDRCLTLSGGAGYLATNPLGRLWRDVRAGPFMQPMSEVDGPIHAGRVALGADLTWA